MARPTYYPEWATTDTTLPVAGTSNKQRPKESLRTIGWDKTQIPAAEEWNWQFDNINDWVVHFDTLNSISKTVNFIGDVSGSFSFSNNSSTIGNVSLQVADNSHNHTSSNISDATSEATANMVAKRDSSGNIKFNRICATGGDSATPSFYFSELANDTGFYSQSDGYIGVSCNATPIGYFGDGGLHMPTYGEHAGNSSTVTTISGNISILTGTIAHGGTIPLPGGYTESQCRWFVSPNKLADGTADNIHEFTCSAEGTRTVTLLIEGNVFAGNLANYMIIGSK